MYEDNFLDLEDKTDDLQETEDNFDDFININFPILDINLFGF